MPYLQINSVTSYKTNIWFTVSVFIILGHCLFRSHGLVPTQLYNNQRKRRQQFSLISLRLLKTGNPFIKMNAVPTVETTKQLEDGSSKLVYGCDDVLFGHIEKMEMASSRRGDFGSFLDAGTGSHSLRWIASILHRTHNNILYNARAEASLPVSLGNYTAGTINDNR